MSKQESEAAIFTWDIQIIQRYNPYLFKKVEKQIAKKRKFETAYIRVNLNFRLFLHIFTKNTRHRSVYLAFLPPCFWRNSDMTVLWISSLGNRTSPLVFNVSFGLLSCFFCCVTLCTVVPLLTSQMWQTECSRGLMVQCRSLVSSCPWSLCERRLWRSLGNEPVSLKDK